jgi:two-component system cell cycle response regulator DivK
MARILCVEDNDDNQFMLHRRLSRAGFDVKLARDGAEAVEWARTLLPDLIVMDIDLPKLDGCEAAYRLKNQLETRHIPIVILSFHDAQEYRDKATAAGCEGYETKPTDFGKLVARIRALLPPASGA